MLTSTIAFVDYRHKPLPDLLRAYPDKAEALIQAARGTYGIWSRAASLLALPLGDWLSRRWLVQTGNPYLHEIETYADILDMHGVYALNLSYEWGCTTGIFHHEDRVLMLRTLDWPLPALGKHAMAVWQRGAAGEYYSVTWPGVAGVFTAMAPGRFCVAINQAPLRKHSGTFATDWLIERSRFFRAGKGLPPAHLLRKVCDEARDYDEAKKMLSESPLPLPVIFTLSGLVPGQGCVIERLEDAAEIRDTKHTGKVVVSNHFESAFAQHGKGYYPGEFDSVGRFRSCEGLNGHELLSNDFSMLMPPIINPYTRLAIIADAAHGLLKVQGFEGHVAVTEVFSLPVGAQAVSV